jgi:hypothetical protein
MSWTPIKQKRKVYSCQQFSAFFLSKIFGNRICQTWFKQLENEGIRGIFTLGYELCFSLRSCCDNEMKNSNESIVHLF